MVRVAMRWRTAGRVYVWCTLAAVAAGCQTAPDAGPSRRGDTQTISITTPGVEGAQCVLTSADLGRLDVAAPVRIEVDRSPEIIVVRCVKACYREASAMISSSGLRAPNGSVTYSYPEETRVALMPMPRCDEPGAARGSGRASPL